MHETTAFFRESPHRCVFYRNSGRVAKLRVWGLHWIAQHANTADANLHNVPRDERADASGRAGGYQISGKKSHHTGDPADEKRYRVSHKRSAPGLADRAVDVRFH